MDVAERQKLILSVLIERHNATAMELSLECGVTPRTILTDVERMSARMPIYTKQGGGGGIFLDDYNPYANLFTDPEVRALHDLMEIADDYHRRMIVRLLRRFGPNESKMD